MAFFRSDDNFATIWLFNPDLVMNFKSIRSTIYNTLVHYLLFSFVPFSKLPMVWENQTESNRIKVLLLNPKFHFWYLITFGKEVVKILQNLCLHFARKDASARGVSCVFCFYVIGHIRPNFCWNRFVDFAIVVNWQKLKIRTQTKLLYSECVVIILV